MTTYTPDEIRDLRSRYSELAGLDNSSIDQQLIDRIVLARRNAQRQSEAERPARIAAAQAAYDAELARYKARNPTGKNGRKAAQRKAREIYPAFGL